jgi:hypothetical protein
MIIEITIKVMMSVGIGLTTIGIVGWVWETIENKSISKLEVHQLPIPKSKLIHLTNEWCHKNLNKNKYPKPRVEIKYNKNKKYFGIYQPNNQTMVVHVNNTNKVIDLITITIHEYQHHQQNINGFLNDYNKEIEKVGYWNNKDEIESRNISTKYNNRCYRDILSNTNLM